jgi:hypothetical protein
LLDTGDGAGNHFIKPAPARDKCSIRQVNMTISLAFLAPELVKAAIEGRLPRGTKAGRARIAEANDGVWKAFRSRNARLSGSE